MRILSKRNPYFSDDPNIVVFELDPETMSFVSVHGNAEALLGFPLEAWMHPDFWSERVHPKDRDEAMDFCKRCIDERRDHELEYRVKDAFGETKWIHEILEFGPERNVVRGYIMDITQRVAQETDIQHTLDLKEELLRIVTEELSFPVNEISGYSTMLERHLSAQGDDVGSDFVIGVRTGVEKLKALIEQLRQVPDSGDVDFDRMSRGTQALSERQAEKERC